MLSSTDAERFTDLVLTDEINQLEILVSFRKDNRTNNLFLKLNHVYKQKLIISPIHEGSEWNETVNTLVKKLERNGVSDEHILLLEDVLSNNFDIVSSVAEGAQEQYCNTYENTKQVKKVIIRK